MTSICRRNLNQVRKICKDGAVARRNKEKRFNEVYYRKHVYMSSYLVPILVLVNGPDHDGRRHDEEEGRKHVEADLTRKEVVQTLVLSHAAIPVRHGGNGATEEPESNKGEKDPLKCVSHARSDG